jgi:lipopolysaccharide biosynthesis regulator YciM
MDFKVLFPLLVTTIVALIGWVIAHRFNARRDLQNKRREIKVKYLIESYRGLEDGASRGKIAGTDRGTKFESAIAVIQLFGDQSQAEMAKNLAQKISSRDPEASTEPLALSLRDSLRVELELGKINEAPVHLRLTK